MSTQHDNPLITGIRPHPAHPCTASRSQTEDAFPVLGVWVNLHDLAQQWNTTTSTTLFVDLPTPPQVAWAFQGIGQGYLALSQEESAFAHYQLVTNRLRYPPSVIAEGLQHAPHATVSGPTGNIAAHDLYGACCRENVFVQNPSAFTGGQDARVFPMVSRQDVATTVSTLKTSLDESVQAALSTQVHADETVITPVPCTTQVVTDHAVGAEATQVHITVNETCTGAVYQTQAVHVLMVQAVQYEAMKRLGTGYTLSGEVKERMIQSHVIDQHQGAVRMQVSGTGIWAYQFTPASLQGLTTLIVGKSRQDATERVLGLTGVQSVSMHIDGRDESTLPGDTQHIHVLVIYGV